MLLTGSQEDVPQPAQPLTAATVTWLEKTSESLALRVTADGAGWLVLAE